MRITRQEMRCVYCGAGIVLELRGPHDLRSTSQELQDLSKRAGWSDEHGFDVCPGHRRLAALGLLK